MSITATAFDRSRLHSRVIAVRRTLQALLKALLSAFNRLLVRPPHDTPQDTKLPPEWFEYPAF